MKTYTQNELNEILRLHQLWLNNDPCGVRADLRGADLRCADLVRADLRGADLRCADLRDANLVRADLDKRYIQIGCIGSKKRMTTYCFDDDTIWCGCFTGTLDEFEKQVNITHANNPQYLAEYIGFVEYLKKLKGE